MCTWMVWAWVVSICFAFPCHFSVKSVDFYPASCDRQISIDVWFGGFWLINLCFFFSKQANLVAAFEQSLSLMTARLQSLSISHEQKVTPPNTSSLPNTHKPEFLPHSTTVVAVVWAVSLEEAAASEVTLIPACSEGLNVGERPRLQLHNEKTMLDQCRGREAWGPGVLHLRLNNNLRVQNMHVRSQQKSHSCILLPLYRLWCE